MMLLASLRTRLQRYFKIYHLRPSSQEKAFMELIKSVPGRDALAQKLLVIHGFRGSRKTCVALHCSTRSQWCFWQPLVEYCDLSSMDDEEVCKFLAKKFPEHTYHRDSLIRGLLRFCVLVSVGCAFMWLNGGEYQQTSEEKGVRSPQERSMNGDELRTKVGNVLLGAFVLCLLCRRSPVIVLDDDYPRVGRYVYDRISSMGHSKEIVLLTSNEGIAECFSQRSDETRFAPFPHATPEEMVRILEVVHQGTSPSRAVSLPVFQVAAAHQLSPHVFSVRWWYTMHATGGIDSVMEGKPPPRTSLWDVVHRLDCACSTTFRAQSLGLSPPISETERSKLKELTGSEPPLKCPRRLALSWCMVDSASGSELTDIKRLRTTLLEATDKHDMQTQDVYEFHIAPLVELIERKFPVFPQFWVRVEGCSITIPVFAVSPHSATIPSLKMAVEVKLSKIASVITVLDPRIKNPTCMWRSLDVNTREDPYLFHAEKQ